MERDIILDVLSASNFRFWDFFFAAFNLRRIFFKDFVETCAILNAKSGRCPSDCKFCAQSVKYNVPIKTYPLLSKGELVAHALKVFEKGIDRFSFVTSGVSLSQRDIKVIGEAIEEILSVVPSAKICASLGQLTEEDLKFLKSCGLRRYHHNLETSKEFYPKISSYQKWEDRFRTVLMAKEVGLEVCCGGIFGLGESEEDVVSFVKSLKELEVDSVPVNFLKPIKGTPLENVNFLTPLKCLKILVSLRLAMPSTSIRVCGGREYNLRDLQAFSILTADALMVGNYLTTKGRNLQDDELMIKDVGLKSHLKV